MNREIETCFQEYVRTSNEALNWLIASWGEKGVDREMCLQEYRALKKESSKLVKKLQILTKGEYGRATN